MKQKILLGGALAVFIFIAYKFYSTPGKVKVVNGAILPVRNNEFAPMARDPNEVIYT